LREQKAKTKEGSVMKMPHAKTSFYVSLAALASIAFLVTGCETFGDHPGHDTGIGAGATAKSVSSHLVRSPLETAANHKYNPWQGHLLKMENEAVTPAKAAAGHIIKGTIQYALLGTGRDGAQVTEVRQLLRGKEVVAEAREILHRSDGTWVSSQEFRLPADAFPGEYSLVQRVETPKAQIAATSNFLVRQSLARATPEPFRGRDYAIPYGSDLTNW
jgi:hypothetical protein